MNTLPQSVASAVSPTSVLSPETSSNPVPVVDPTQVTAPNQGTPPSTGSSSATSVSAPEGSVPVSNPTTVKPPVGTVSNKPVSSKPGFTVGVLDYWRDGKVGGECVQAHEGTQFGTGCKTTNLENEARRKRVALSKATNDKQRAELEFELAKVYARIQDTKFFGSSGESAFAYIGVIVKSNFYNTFNDGQKNNLWHIVNVGLKTGSIGAVDLRGLATLFKHINLDGRIDYTKELKDDLMSKLNFNGSSPALNSPGGEAGFGIRDAFSLALGFSPAGDVLSVIGSITGYDPISGRQLEPLDRWLGLLGLIGLGGEAVAFAKGLRGTQIAARAARAERAADQGSYFARTLIDCTNSFSANTKVWVSRAANDLAKKTKTALEKSNRAVITVAKTALAAVAIFTVGVGTPVLALNEKTKLESIQPVTATHVHIDPEIVTLTLETDAGVREVVETTPEHPFAVRTPNGLISWVNAIDLKKDQNLIRVGGRSGKLLERMVATREKLMYNLSVARDHTFFVGDGQWLVHNCNTRYVIKQATGNYVSWFDTTLDPAIRVGTRSTHFRASNEALYKAMQTDPQLANFYRTNYPDVYNYVQPLPGGGFNSGSPPGFTWHHSTTAQAGSPGVMQLVPRPNHRTNSSLYHPTGSGGCKEWGGGCK